MSRDGNARAKDLVGEVFELRRTSERRGLGVVSYSALRLAPAYERFDAEQRFALVPQPVRENRAWLCPQILRGAKKPPDCPLFGTTCTPESPIGSCMVSAEGACAAW